MDIDDKINHLTSLIEASLLPDLRYELGSQFMEAKHFESFCQDLDINLIQIFDLIQQNEDLLYEVEGNTRKLRFKFILLLCEQSAPNTLFQSRNAIFLENIQKLIKKHFVEMLRVDDQLVKLIFDYYKERLRENIWKKNLGSIHGFDIFCQQLYSQKYQLNKDICTFTLSVSLLLEEFYEPVYKELSFRLIKLILYNTPEAILNELNLHHGIYETLFRNIPKVDTVLGASSLWECLYKCIDLMNQINYSKWNKLDDLFEALFRRIAFESNTDIFNYLFTLFPVLCTIKISSDRNLLKFPKVENSTDDIYLENLRDFWRKAQPKVFYRWVNKLLKLFIAESHRLLVNEIACVELLGVIHTCYIVCVMSIPLKVCKPHLVEFLEKFTSVLMDVIASHRSNKEITMNVRRLLETILYHLDNECHQTSVCSEISLYRKNLNTLLQHKIFG